MTKTADVIVIGSGIVGNATAYELAKRGKSVLVLEKYPTSATVHPVETARAFVWLDVFPPKRSWPRWQSMTSGRHWARSWTQIWSMSSAVA